MHPELCGERDGRGEEEEEVEDVEDEGDERVVEAGAQAGDERNGEQVQHGYECKDAGENGEVDACGGTTGGLLRGEGCREAEREDGNAKLYWELVGM